MRWHAPRLRKRVRAALRAQPRQAGGAPAASTATALKVDRLVFAVTPPSYQTNDIRHLGTPDEWYMDPMYESLIGIGAVVLNHAKIGKNCLVGAGSLVTEGKEFPDGSMIMGSPAKVVRQLTPEQIEGLRRSAQGYMKNAQRFKAGLKKIG